MWRAVDGGDDDPAESLQLDLIGALLKALAKLLGRLGVGPAVVCDDGVGEWVDSRHFGGEGGGGGGKGR